MGFLPTTVKEMKALGWDYVDIVLFSGDAYIDHPSFGTAVVSRLFEDEGLRVAVVPQPNWRDDLRDFKKFGTPRLCFCVTAGVMDSMVNHYTANKRLRSNDAYTAGGAAGFRPDYAVTTYTKILKNLFPTTPVLIGGIEASLRRLTHYDYWQDGLKPSILVESGADFLLYGMGERVIREVARAMRNGYNAKLLRSLKQVGFVADKKFVDALPSEKVIALHSFEQCKKDKRAFGENFTKEEVESNRLESENILVEKTGNDYVVINPMHAALSSEELDSAFDLPYMRAPHPRYKGRGDIPAWEMIKHSVNIHRGCFGGCSFCTISAHQGKFISSRSEASIMREVEAVTKMPDFRGTITDIGGPSANMYGLGGKNKNACAKCVRPSCLHPKVCPNLNNDHRPLLDLYRKIRTFNGVKHAYIGSGIRYDLFDNSDYLREVVVHHTSGRLKVAPEHTEDGVLALMRKSSFSLFEELNAKFNRICRDNGLRYQLIPYFISSHPGCREADMRALSQKVLGKLHFTLEQVQDLTPTPMTLSSVMFYTGENPYTGEKVYVARSQDDKRKQKQYFFKKNQYQKITKTMKTILILFSIFMLATSCGTSDETPTTPPTASKYQKYAKENEIKIMSFNVRTKTSSDEGINHWDQRKEACVALVKDHKPTIIGFQEAQYGSQWIYLKEQLRADYDGYGVGRTDGKESGETMGILYDRNIVEMIDCGTFWLSETPEKPSRSWGMTMNRTATWGLFKHLHTGKEFFYINTHLPLTNDKYGDTPKIEGMKIIANKFKEYQKQVDALFLTGDLNVEASHEAMDAIKSFMRNARTYANRSDNYGTTNGFESDTKNSKIDHIYYSKELKNPVEYYTIRDTYNGVKFVSDHYPIYTIIKL